MVKRDKRVARKTNHRPATRFTGAAPSSTRSSAAVDVMGWTLLAHPLFLLQIEKLVAAAEADVSGAKREGGANTRLLAHLLDLASDKIPRDPGHATFRHGGTLGKDRKHWFRAKTGNGRYRLFYRYQSAARIIVYAWVNDAESFRAYQSKTDAYTAFARMLDAGNPPEEWIALVGAASQPAAARRLAALVKGRARRK